ncbi:hypothetical protein RDI58_014548 [Solanum bulbocastanum]|uniref:Uncharacterized protein n=1 Tax=Solanum bulbocastanum TaxID=147425 RepID=A0AAN8TJU6_SOLBU
MFLTRCLVWHEEQSTAGCLLMTKWQKNLKLNLSLNVIVVGVSKMNPNIGNPSRILKVGLKII